MIGRLRAALRRIGLAPHYLGHLDAVELSGSRLRIEGWANHLRPRLTYDGAAVPVRVRQVVRPDLAGVAPGGEAWGFALDADLPAQDPDIAKLALRLNRGCLVDPHSHPGMFTPQSAVEACAAAILAGDPQADAADLVERSRRARNPLLPVRVGHALQAAGQAGAAEAVLRACLGLPEVRSLARHALITLLAAGGRLPEAVDLLDAARGEDGLGPGQALPAAILYAGIGRFGEARALIREAGDPAADEAAAHALQFVALLERYPAAEARRMLAELRARFRTASLPEIEADILAALAERRPYFLVRMGDGEGAYLRLSAEDEAEFHGIYRTNRREMLDFWFRDPALVDDPRFARAADAFNAAIEEADCIGAFSDAAIAHEYGTVSRRGITWVVNTLRKALAMAEADPVRARSIAVRELTVHYDLALSGALGRILQDRPVVGLITCHRELAPALQRHHGLGRVELIKIPGEQIHAGALGADAAAGRHWPDRYDEICAQLAQGDRRGEVWLVAAGLLGKIYGAALKRSGAVVIDIGAVADLWMGKGTRTFPDLPAALNPMTSLRA
ncbi:hypothetical protein [Methylobacterium oryzisoli]|uniref:hypothetical protein n=1 Tax=Methylobacterium oryzisoli TaxID=3385502 RepID=UPI003891CC0B